MSTRSPFQSQTCLSIRPTGVMNGEYEIAKFQIGTSLTKGIQARRPGRAPCSFPLLCGNFPFTEQDDFIKFGNSRSFFPSRSCQCFALIRQILPPESSATSNDPSGPSVTPTGRP